METSSCELCIVCGQEFSSVNLGFLTPHSKEVCLCCGKTVGKSCAKFGHTRPPLPDHLREMREGKSLGLRDYLFGLFYFRNPVHNLWLPIAVLGTIFSLFIYIIVQVWTQGA